MTNQSMSDIIEYYANRLKKFGATKEALVYSDFAQQEKRYSLMCEVDMIDPHASVLDVGCGLGFFADFLRGKGWKGEYTGIDITQEMVDAAAQRLPGDFFYCSDIRDFQPKEIYDYVFCCATIQHRPQAVEPEQYVKDSVSKMFSLAKKAVVFDVFTTRVDYFEDHILYIKPGRLLDLCYELTPRLTLRNDCRPFEIMMYLYKMTQKDELNIFKEWRTTLGQIA